MTQGHKTEQSPHNPYLGLSGHCRVAGKAIGAVLDAAGLQDDAILADLVAQRHLAQHVQQRLAAAVAVRQLVSRCKGARLALRHYQLFYTDKCSLSEWSIISYHYSHPSCKKQSFSNRSEQ